MSLSFIIELEQTIQVLVVNFYKYILKQIKSSFQKILQKELNYMLSNIGSKKAADEFIQDLGANYDGTLTVINALIGRITSQIINFSSSSRSSSRLCSFLLFPVLH
uniref:Uncharacterized protein n=1 Tax=Sarcophilus harrisii TaxID=9305 RepID=A0A7N4PZ33_SARHA